ncbi:MAG: YHYH domain-containing protein [Acinetobacter venetianus]|uniref:YHYH domain-containing protein n=1 Tax=Acinetobacter venetianus TaxID=52133 RepID=UPI0035BE6CA8
MQKAICALVVLLGALPTASSAEEKLKFNHSGGTDKCGCHFNRSTGEYHCHTRKQRGGDCPP